MKSVRLPYINNAKAILVTLVINIAIVFLFQWPNGITHEGLIWDSLICVLVTIVIDMWIVYQHLKKLRSEGKMPAQAPLSRLMQRLPQNPAALGVIYFVCFGGVTLGANLLITKFFGIQNMAFAPWMVYKLLYSTVLSIKIVEYCIFRYVQPDWAKGGHGVQAIRNPIPRISLFKEIYGSVTGNIALNVIIGSLLGGATLTSEGTVMLFPVTAKGIPITGLIFGLISGALVTNGVMKTMDKNILTTGPALLEKAVTNKWLYWMPVRKAPLTCFICAGVMAFSAVALPAIMMAFNLSILNFYQVSIFITLYAGVISKPISRVLIRRCMQPDYIRHRLKRPT